MKRARNADLENETKRRRARSITREGCKALMTEEKGWWEVVCSEIREVP